MLARRGTTFMPQRPPFTLLQIDHVVLRVRDIAAMQAFYCDVLGCSVERRLDAIGLLQLRAGRSLIDLVGIDATEAESTAHNMDHLCLSVAPFDRGELEAHLRKHGVRLGEFGTRYGAEGMGPSQYLYDPEENMVELKGPPDDLGGARPPGQGQGG